MRILALDVGERRIGLAISDPLGMLASPLGTLEVTDPRQVALRLQQLVREYQISELVVGLPLRTDERPSERADAVRTWAQAVAQELSLPLALVDERFSTAEAIAKLRAAGESAASMRDRLDAAAATIILQTYLDQMQEQRVQRET